MSVPSIRHRGFWAALVLAAFVLPAWARAEEKEFDYGQLIRSRRGALVSMRVTGVDDCALRTLHEVLLEADGSVAREERLRMVEACGLIIGAEGLLVSTSSVFRDASEAAVADGPSAPACISQVKSVTVFVGDDQAGVSAKLIGIDGVTGLALLEIAPPQEPLEHLVISRNHNPRLGERVFALEKLGAAFGRETVFTEARIGGKPPVPQDLFLPASPLGGPGAVVCSEEGRLVGLVLDALRPAESDPRAAEALPALPTRPILPAIGIAQAVDRIRAEARDRALPAKAAEAQPTPAAVESPKPTP